MSPSNITPIAIGVISVSLCFVLSGYLLFIHRRKQRAGEKMSIAEMMNTKVTNNETHDETTDNLGGEPNHNDTVAAEKDMTMAKVNPVEQMVSDWVFEDTATDSNEDIYSGVGSDVIPTPCGSVDSTGDDMNALYGKGNGLTKYYNKQMLDDDNDDLNDTDVKALPEEQEDLELYIPSPVHSSQFVSHVTPSHIPPRT